jgi:hypothetical protein
LYAWIEKAGAFVSLVLVFLWNLLTSVPQRTLKFLAWAWAEIQPHLQWIGPLFGIAMAAWRWWDKRESVIWRRVMRLLADQGRYVQSSCRYSLAAVLYPTPATRPQEPLFAVGALRRIFGRRWWHPMDRATPLKWGRHFLKQAHTQLNAKDSTIALHRSFAVGQRYSAFVLQGALAAAYASNSKRAHGRNRLNQVALNRFEDALALEGKGSDAVVLELKALQLRKLGRVRQALTELSNLQASLEGRLQAVTPLEEGERQALLVQLMRVVRYQSELDHQAGAPGVANGRLLGLTQNPVTASVFRDHLEYHDLLERAYYHEVHACVRVELTGTLGTDGALVLPNNGVAQQSLSVARADYNALYDQVEPRSFSWRRWLRRTDKKDGSLKLRAAASQGLERLDEIEAGKGCQVCSAQKNGVNSNAPVTGPTHSG